MRKAMEENTEVMKKIREMFVIIRSHEKFLYFIVSFSHIKAGNLQLKMASNEEGKEEKVAQLALLLTIVFYIAGSGGLVFLGCWKYWDKSGDEFFKEFW